MNIVKTAFSVAKNDLRISGLYVLGTLVSLIPLAGPLLLFAAQGLSHQLADDTLGNTKPDNSFGIRYLYALFASLMVGLITFVGTLFLILPGIYASIKLSLVIPAVWIGDKGPIEALGESWARTSGNVVTILAVGLLFSLVAVLVLIPVFGLGIASSALSGGTELGLVAAVPLYATLFGVIVVMQVVGVASATVMYRSFGDFAGDAPGAINDSTQF